MSIKDNILAVQTKIENDPKFARDFRRQAINALYAGMGKPEWETYMRNFVDDPPTAETPAQLMRLTSTAADLSTSYLKEARAYALANAICIPGTRTGLLQGITDLLDQPDNTPVDPPS